ncbi:type II secretion system GspH family protein [Dyella sp. LX-66]|uniref:PulJ/GspJ family protein n=1 Tax=unclassified Dyella TaxID=2634549 RepID=UPI001BE02F39|nr:MULTISPECIES: type II secretion system protein [unclassified Dyella]MBT2119823.1 type II secretion system GspH family protein [Dyella sp. LX-1]MBT2142300.1 type II secretion system GspH family protein [Dyella sp. LX-66]
MKMHSPCPFPERRRQRGDVLLESLIAVLITAIIGAGTAYMTTRLTISAKDQRLEGIAAQQMRELLQRYGASLCTGGANQGLAKLRSHDGELTDLQVICADGAARTVNGISVQGTTQVLLCTSADPAGSSSAPSIAVGTGDVTACASTKSSSGSGSGNGNGNGNSGNGNGNGGGNGNGNSGGNGNGKGKGYGDSQS